MADYIKSNGRKNPEAQIPSQDKNNASRLSNEEVTNQLDELTEEADKERTKKPGSQSNSGGSGMHNNGRGGGK